MKQKWTLEDLRLLNPPEKNQKTSFIEVLISNAHVTTDLLLKSAEELESTEGEIFIFGQIPLLRMPRLCNINVPGQTVGTALAIDVYQASIIVNEMGHIVCAATSSIENLNNGGSHHSIPITQVRAKLKLDAERAKLHKKYIDCLSPNGLRDAIIGDIKPWMDLPIARQQYPSRRIGPLTASLLQSEIAHRSRVEFNFALLKFLKGYSLATLSLLPPISEASAYFTMIAPGRIAGATTPQSVLFGLPPLYEALSPSVTAEQIQTALKSPLALHDRVVQELSAMNRLNSEGRSELALIGCISVIEWYLNDYIRAKNNKSANPEGEWSISIEKIFKSKLLNEVSEETQIQLRKLARLRNEIVHGPPLSRPVIGAALGIGESRVTTEVFQNALQLAILTYQKINQRTIDAIL